MLPPTHRGNFSAVHMADADDNRVPADVAAINLREDWEIQYWSSHLGCTEAELRAAMPNAEA